MAWIADGAGRSPDRSATRPGRFRRRLAGGFATLAACLIAAAIAAAADPVPVPGVPGITAPAGLARDSNGDLWVADSGGGVCRLLDPPFAPLNGMVCPPKALQGPKSPGQMAFDPASGFFFVGERATVGGAGVWRLHLNQAADPAFIDSATLLLDLPAERVLGMAYNAATGALHYSTKDSSAIQRIANAATCVAPCAATTVGSAVAKGVRSMVHDGDGRLYLADAPGVTRIATPGVGDTQAALIPGFDTGTYEALAFDPAADGAGRIYAGTNNPTGADWIDVLRVSDDAVVSRYSEGFAAVTAIGIDTRDSTDRSLDVADDNSHKQFGEDTVGAGRRLSVPFELLGRPTIVDAPPSVGNASTVTFGYTSPTDTTFWCSLDGGPALACGGGFASDTTYPDLADGNHVFQVQSDNPITGGRTKRWFEIDTRAPAITLGDVLVNGTSAQIGFAADDITAEFKCTIDGGAPAPCESPARYANLAVGEHTFSVRATDFAGNTGSPVGATFHVVAPPVATPLTATSPVVAPVPVAAWKPGRISATLRGRTLRVVFDAPPGAKFARFTITRKPASPVRTTAVRVRGGKRNVVQLVLPRAVALRLQSKRFTVTINSGTRQGRLTTWAGTGVLRIVAALVPKAGPGR
jgi:hypothetical protein